MNVSFDERAFLDCTFAEARQRASACEGRIRRMNRRMDPPCAAATLAAQQCCCQASAFCADRPGIGMPAAPAGVTDYVQLSDSRARLIPHRVVLCAVIRTAIASMQ